MIENIQAISFDLDDSLWSIGPIIIRAEKIIHEHMSEHFPRVTEQFGPDEMRELRTRVHQSHSHLSHDLSALRQASLEIMLEESGYPRHHSEDLMTMFLDLRHDVEYFPDVLPALEKLAEKFRIFAISNGNADVARLGLNCFEGQVSARSEGVGKPDVQIFHNAARHLQLQPEQILHVGDHQVEDIGGALEAGMVTAWLNRQAHSWEQDFEPHHEIANLDELVELLGC